MSHALQEFRTFILHLFPSTRSVRLTKMTIEPAAVFLLLMITAPAACCPRCAVPSASVHIPADALTASPFPLLAFEGLNVALERILAHSVERLSDYLLVVPRELFKLRCCGWRKSYGPRYSHRIRA